MLGTSQSHPGSRKYRFGEAAVSPLPTILLSSLMIGAICLGGGGVRYAMANLAVQLLAIAILALRYEAVFAFWRAAPIAMRLVVAATILLPLCQLVPVPQSVWSALPGRDLVVQAFELTGRSGWAPTSVDPIRTSVASTALIVPVAVLTAGWTLERSQLILLGWVAVALGLANFALGIPQVLSGGTSALIYHERAADSILHGTFANRNSAGLFLAAALTLAIVLPFPRPHRAALPIRIAIGAFLLVAIILTRSRSALLVTTLPLALAALRAFCWSRRGNVGGSRAGIGMLAIALVLAGAAATTLAVAPGRVADTVERFDTRENARTFIWEDAAFSADRFWPVGAGMGTFDEVFQLDEALENTTLKRAGRAHNDYLELAIEAGLAGLILAAAWLALIAWLAWRARRSSDCWPAWGGATILLAIALQSMVDYPLRNLAMLAMAALALLILARGAIVSGNTR